MSPEEALNIVDSSCSMLQLNRAQHIKIADAIKVLKELIDKNKDKKNG